MVTNALSPLRVIEALQDRVTRGHDRGDVLGPGQRGQQRERRPRGVPRQQGRAQHLHAQLRGPAQASAGLWSSWPPAGYAPTSAARTPDSPSTRASRTSSRRSTALQGKPGLHYVDYLGRTVACGPHAGAQTDVRRPEPRSTRSRPAAWALMHGSSAPTTATAISPRRSASASAADAARSSSSSATAADPRSTGRRRRHRRPLHHPIVDKFEAHGLVERHPHPDDRRRKLVALTAAGHDAIATADAILLRPPPAIRKLPADDLGQLTGLLTRLLDADAAEPGDPKSSEPVR